MRIATLGRNVALTCGLAFAAFSTPTLASDVPMGATPDAPAPASHAMSPGLDIASPSPQMRDSWMSECVARMRDGGVRRRHRAQRCANIWDQHYAYYEQYRGHSGYAIQGPAYAHGYGYGQGACCQPAMMPAAPVMQARAPECTETIEYEDEYVPVGPAPARRYIPRAQPTKRVKVVPDKRIKVQ